MGNENELTKLEHDNTFHVKKVSPFFDNGAGGIVRGSADVNGVQNVNVISGTITATIGTVEITNDVGNPIPVSGTVAVTQSTSPWVVSNGGTFAVQDSQDVMLGTDFSTVFGTDDIVAVHGAAIPSSELLIGIRNTAGNMTYLQGANNNADNVAVSSSGFHVQTISNNVVYDGTTWDRMRGDSTDGVLVNLGTNNDVTVTSGSISATQGTSPWVVSLTSTTITGTVAVTQSGTWDEVGINDSGNSITVDAPVATPVFVRLSDGAAAISTLPVSLTSTTITGTVAATQSGTWNIGTVTTLTGITNTVTTQAAKSATGTLSNVSGSATSVTLLSSNTSRLGAAFVNDSSAICYVKTGTTASATDYTFRLYPNDYLELPFNFTGRIDAIWASATGTMRVTEFT